MPPPLPGRYGPDDLGAGELRMPAGKGPFPVAVMSMATDGRGVGIDAQACVKQVIVPLMGGTPVDKPAAYALASPADHLPPHVRQLLVMGEFGPLMRPYAAVAQAAGEPVELLAPEGANHFDIVTSGSSTGTGWWRLSSGGRVRTRPEAGRCHGSKLRSLIGCWSVRRSWSSTRKGDPALKRSRPYIASGRHGSKSHDVEARLKPSPAGLAGLASQRR